MSSRDDHVTTLVSTEPDPSLSSAPERGVRIAAMLSWWLPGAALVTLGALDRTAWGEALGRTAHPWPTMAAIAVALIGMATGLWAIRRSMAGQQPIGRRALVGTATGAGML